MSFLTYLAESAHNAYIFDLDDTLIKSLCKILVRKDGEVVARLTPEEFNTYKLNPGESFDFVEFQSMEMLKKTGRKYKYWGVAQNVNNAIQTRRTNSILYILTARPHYVAKDLHWYLVGMGLTELKASNVYAIGDLGKAKTIAELKRETIEDIKDRHKVAKVFFFDDDDKNLKLASTIGGPVIPRKAT
jgi:hypothetical protein